MLRRQQISGTGATELAILLFSLAAARVADGIRSMAISASFILAGTNIVPLWDLLAVGL
jgi:hypothetical protein